jgi:hypothetical protein
MVPIEGEREDQRKAGSSLIRIILTLSTLTHLAKVEKRAQLLSGPFIIIT